MLNTIVIKSNRTARKLIQNNFNIVDIKPHKHNRDKTVFIFELSDLLLRFCEQNNLEV